MLSGNLSGNLSGKLPGNLSGNLSGKLPGNHTAKLQAKHTYITIFSGVLTPDSSPEPRMLCNTRTRVEGRSELHLHPPLPGNPPDLADPPDWPDCSQMIE